MKELSLLMPRKKLTINRHRTILIVTFYILATISFSCKTNETEPVKVTFSDVIGKWSVEQIEYSGFDKPLNSYNRIDNNPSSIGKDDYVFNADSTYTENYTQSDFYSIDSTFSSTSYEKGKWQIPSTSTSTVFLKRAEPQSAFLSGPYSVTLISNEKFVAGYRRPYILPTSPYTLQSYNQKIYYRKAK